MAAISLMKNMVHLKEIHAVLSQQVDVIHSKLHSNFSKCMATELKNAGSGDLKEYLS